MKLAQCDLYVNHPFLVLGSSEPFEGEVRLEGGADVVASDRHLLVSVVPQIRLVRVRVWQDTGVSPGVLGFDGELTLGRTLCVSDAVGANRLEIPLEQPGATRIAVLVDEPGAASCVDLVLGGHRERGRLTEVSGLPLPSTFGLPPAGDAFDEIGLILSETDLPVRRLAAAMKVMSATGPGDSGAYPPGREELPFWLHGANIAASRDEASAVGKQIEEALFRAGATWTDADFAGFARQVVSD